MPIACPVLPPRFIAPAKKPLENGVGVLIINLGSPTKPNAWSIARYLQEFLLDLRVVELPKAFWSLLLYIIILPFRSRKNIKKYQTVWLKTNNQNYEAFGSPLHVYSERFVERLKKELPYPVMLAMRYGKPSIREAVLALSAQGCQTIMIVPQYPQHASCTTGTALSAVYRATEDFRIIPRMIGFGNAYTAFPTASFYIDALVQQWRQFFEENGKPEVFVLSFHGLPNAMIEKGDTYQHDCEATAQALQKALGDGVTFKVGYQSRFGAQSWLSPSTESVLTDLATQGTQHVAVACPGFTADCLETLEEINIELRQHFLAKGGKTFQYVPCLNDDPIWVSAFANAIQQQIHHSISSSIS